MVLHILNDQSFFQVCIFAIVLFALRKKEYPTLKIMQRMGMSNLRKSHLIPNNEKNILCFLVDYNA